MTNRTFGYANEINGHYEIALSVDNYEAVDLAFQEVVSKSFILKYMVINMHQHAHLKCS